MKKALLLLAVTWLFTLQAHAQCDSTFTIVTPQPACAQEFVVFEANADPATVTAYAWNFGNGLASQRAVDSTRYPYNAVATSYSVTLTVTDTSGRRCTTTQTLNVAYTPQLAVTVDTATLLCYFGPQPTQFTWNFTLNTTGLGPYTWDWGDGSPPTVSNTLTQSHTYGYGTYLVRVFANNATCPGFVQPLSFYTEPQVNLSTIAGQTNPCDGDTIIVANITNSPAGNIDYYEWHMDFGNPTGDIIRVLTRDSIRYAYDLGAGGINPCLNPQTRFGFPKNIRLFAINACQFPNSSNS
ncbi:MAG: PKD domain-containing protein, partial [Bacteroidota bacterium]